MKIWRVSTPGRSNRRPILKPKLITSYYPSNLHQETDYFGNSYADPHPPDVTTKPRALHARPYSTVGFHRNPTPLALPGDDIEDRPDSAEPSFLFGATEGIERGAPLTFVPELDSWITNANTDYERDTVFRVRKAMNGYRTPRQRSRSVSPTRTRPYFGRTTTYGDGFNFSSTYANPGTSGVPTWNPYVCTPRYNDDMFMSQIARHLPGENSVPNMTMYATPRDSRPMHRHMRRSSFTKGYVHDLSCFTSTQPMVTGHYIIHPDWVSERLSPRREKTMNL